jgi:hypothetical protein
VQVCRSELEPFGQRRSAAPAEKRIEASRDWPLKQSLTLLAVARGPMKYRCEATSIAGFVQQLAVAYIGRGYFFFVLGEIPLKKDPSVIDERLVEKYGVEIGKTARARRKASGFANIQYLRFERSFVLLATHGKHRFFDREGSLIRDARELPIKFGGYSISYRGGHPHVRIEQRQYLDLKAYFADVAVHRTADRLKGMFKRLPFEPYAPVRSQLFGILREVNRRRKLAGFDLVSSNCIRVRRRVVRPFERQGDASSNAPPERASAA